MEAQMTGPKFTHDVLVAIDQANEAVARREYDEALLLAYILASAGFHRAAERIRNRVKAKQEEQGGRAMSVCSRRPVKIGPPEQEESMKTETAIGVPVKTEMQPLAHRLAKLEPPLPLT